MSVPQEALEYYVLDNLLYFHSDHQQFSEYLDTHNGEPHPRFTLEKTRLK